MAFLDRFRNAPRWGYPVTWQVLQLTLTAVVVLWVVVLLWRLFLLSIYPMSAYGQTILISLIVVLLLDMVVGIVLQRAHHAQLMQKVEAVGAFATVAAGVLVVGITGLGIPLTLYTADVLLFVVCLLVMALALVQLGISVTLVQEIAPEIKEAMHSSASISVAQAAWPAPPLYPYPHMFDAR